MTTFKHEPLEAETVEDLRLHQCERCHKRPPAAVAWVNDEAWESAFICSKCVEELTDHGRPDAPVLPGEQRELIA